MAADALSRESVALAWNCTVVCLILVANMWDGILSRYFFIIRWRIMLLLKTSLFHLIPGRSLESKWPMWRSDMILSFSASMTGVVLIAQNQYTRKKGKTWSVALRKMWIHYKRFDKNDWNSSSKMVSRTRWSAFNLVEETAEIPFNSTFTVFQVKCQWHTRNVARLISYSAGGA